MTDRRPGGPGRRELLDPLEGPPHERRPNVVVVLADDLGWGDLGCYGATRIDTPNLDRLAAGGVRCTDAHAASSVCTPSRYALLTGRYPWRSPLTKGVLMGHGPAVIEPDRPTLASVLRDHGYQTAAVGKWHLGLGWRRSDGTVWDAFDGRSPMEYQLGDPLARHDEADLDTGEDVDYAAPFTGGPTALGFDQFFGIAGSLNMPPYAYLRQDRAASVPTRRKERFLPGQRPGFETEDWDEQEVDLRFTAEACRVIDERDPDRPLLLYFAPSAPHRPQVPPDFLVGASRAGARGDAVAFVDWMVGELLGALDRAGIAEETLLVFTSDNGAPTIFPDEGHEDHRPNGPWRGQKGDLWEGGHREPLVVHWPGRLDAGGRCDEGIGLVDLLATLAGLLDLPLPRDASPDGVDRSDALRRAAAAPTGPGRAADGADAARARVVASMGGALCVTRGRWKALFSTGSGGGLSSPAGAATSAAQPVGQLYDLLADPGEQTDLWADRPDVVAELAGVLGAVGAPGPPPATTAVHRRHDFLREAQ